MGIKEIENKEGLEEAINAFMKNPSMGVPEEMRIFAPKIEPCSETHPALSVNVGIGYDGIGGR